MIKDDDKKKKDEALLIDDSEITEALDRLIERARIENEALNELMRLLNKGEDNKNLK